MPDPTHPIAPLLRVLVPAPAPVSLNARRLQVYATEIAALNTHIDALLTERNRLMAEHQALQRLPGDVAEGLLGGQEP